MEEKSEAQKGNFWIMQLIKAPGTFIWVLGPLAPLHTTRECSPKQQLEGGRAGWRSTFLTKSILQHITLCKGLLKDTWIQPSLKPEFWIFQSVEPAYYLASANVN